MLIEYKIKFEGDGVTITQRVEPDASGSTPVKPAAQSGITNARSLGSSFQAGRGGGGGESTGPGGGGGESTGPGGGGGEGTGPGGGGGEGTGPGGGGPGARPVVVLGPIVIGGSSPTDTSSVPLVKTQTMAPLERQQQKQYKS